jgi:hypothetical protein
VNQPKKKGFESTSQIGSARQNQLPKQRYFEQDTYDHALDNTEVQVMNAQEYDQHLQDMETAIEQNQIRLRNELEQMKNVQNSALLQEFSRSIDPNEEQI